MEEWNSTSHRFSLQSPTLLFLSLIAGQASIEDMTTFFRYQKLASSKPKQCFLSWLKLEHGCITNSRLCWTFGEVYSISTRTVAHSHFVCRGPSIRKELGGPRSSSSAAKRQLRPLRCLLSHSCSGSTDCITSSTFYMWLQVIWMWVMSPPTLYSALSLDWTRRLQMDCTQVMRVLLSDRWQS